MSAVERKPYSVVQYSTKTPTQRRYGDLRSRIVCLAGPPGVGKTQTGLALEHYLNADGIKTKYFPERINVEHLTMYLMNKKDEAYSFQDGMVQRRWATYYEACTYVDTTDGIAIVDGPIIADNVFEFLNYEGGFIDEKHHLLYMRMMTTMFGTFREPDYLVYFDSTPATNVRRIRGRNNTAEIVVYDEKFYQTYRDTTRYVLGATRIAAIPFDDDLPFAPDGFIKREAIYRVLDDIISRAYESEGLPATVATTTTTNTLLFAHNARDHITLRQQGRYYVDINHL